MDGPKVNMAGVKSRDDLLKCLEKIPNKVIQEDLRRLLITTLNETKQNEEHFKTELALK